MPSGRALHIPHLFLILLCLVLVLLSIPAGASTANGEITNVEVINKSDTDGDGYASTFNIRLEADTTIEDTVTDGEPYFRITLDGQTIKETEEVPRTDSYTEIVQISGSELSSVSAGEHELQIILLDKNLLSVDQIQTWNQTIRFEPKVAELEATRTETSIGSPIFLTTTPLEPCTESYILGLGCKMQRSTPSLKWNISGPENSSASVRSVEEIVSFRPDKAGNYTITRQPEDDPGAGGGANVTIEVKEDRNWKLIKEYAPVVHFPEGTRYFPTRIEAFVANSEANCIFGRMCDTGLTMGTLSQSEAPSKISLAGEKSQYQEYQEKYPETIYASVHRNVEFEGDSVSSERYTAITYWLFYTYDPKHQGECGDILRHESDLETVTILLEDGIPKWVGASQHYGGEIREWSKAPRTGSHLEIYPSLGAHSNFFINTENFEGQIPYQEQFRNGDDPADVDETITACYTDQTGDEANWSYTGTKGQEYELVQLTGSETWADWTGIFTDVGDGAQMPMKRDRWNKPGKWMGSELLHDEDQIEASMQLMPINGIVTNQTTITVNTRFSNDGAKPHTFWLIIEAVPSGKSWGSNSTQQLDVIPIPLDYGAKEQWRSFSTRGPNKTGDWDIRVRLSSYQPDATEYEDIQSTKVVKGKQFEGRESNPTVTPATTTANSPTSTTDGAGNGFGLVSALVALCFLVLGRRVSTL